MQCHSYMHVFRDDHVGTGELLRGLARGDRFSCNPGWLPTCCVAKDSLEPLIIPPHLLRAVGITGLHHVCFVP